MYMIKILKVEKKMKQVEEKDQVRNFQPPISGEEIMEIFNLTPCRTVGDIKEQIKEAILDGEIQNNYNEAHSYMLKIATQLGLETDK